jgi:hypothetical protein
MNHEKTDEKSPEGTRFFTSCHGCDYNSRVYSSACAGTNDHRGERRGGL